MKLDDILLPYQKKFCNDTSSRKIFLKARQIGFSFMISYCCIKKAATNPNSLSIVISVNERSSQELLKKVLQWAEALKIASDNQISWEANSSEVRLSNGSRIISIPGGNPSAGRGFTVTGILAIDEFAYVPNIEEIWQSVVPTMTNRIRGIQPEIIIGSTPAAKSSLFGKIWFEDDNFKHFNITIEDAAKDGLPVDIEELHKLIPDNNQFDIEFNCKWSDTQGTFIDTNILDFYRFDGKTTDGYYCGIDFGYKNDNTAISIVKVKDDKKYLENIISLKNVDFLRQFEIIEELHKKYKFIAGYADENGIGAAISEQITKNICSKIKGYHTTGSNKTPNYEFARNEIFNHRLMFNEDFKDVIIQDFNNVQKSVSETGKVSYFAGRKFGNHSDITSSLILVLQAIKDNPIKATMPFSYSVKSAFGNRISRL